MPPSCWSRMPTVTGSHSCTSSGAGSAGGARDSPRLRALAAHSDGFRLAEIDLELRGRGELVGTRQHGQEVFRVAELPRDAELLERAAAQARRIIEADGDLEAPEHALLRDALIAAYGAEAEAPIRA